jgi:lactate dehydrogenase-like 2-hydroxyacid dehydrogenase
LWQQASPDASLKAHGHAFSASTTSAKTGATTLLINALPALQVISVVGARCDAVDVARQFSASVIAELALKTLTDLPTPLSSYVQHTATANWMANVSAAGH